MTTPQEPVGAEALSADLLHIKAKCLAVIGEHDASNAALQVANYLLSALGALATITAQAQEIARLSALVYVPGQWRCAKCKFVVHKMVLCANTGNVGLKADTKTEPCPNGCGPLWPVTWKEDAFECGERLVAQHDEIQALKAEPTRPPTSPGPSPDFEAEAREWFASGGADRLAMGDDGNIHSLSNLLRRVSAGRFETSPAPVDVERLTAWFANLGLCGVTDLDATNWARRFLSAFPSLTQPRPNGVPDHA